jgi:hypothetical protein
MIEETTASSSIRTLECALENVGDRRTLAALRASMSDASVGLPRMRRTLSGPVAGARPEVLQKVDAAKKYDVRRSADPVEPVLDGRGIDTEVLRELVLSADHLAGVV